ncbi:MAG TPA: MBL fold metallo-hydrolase, partial [Desulfobacteraceae bacterium]|nr:MBL fold metallo-hydrolase [Desulfobacteraceae bacterium]
MGTTYTIHPVVMGTKIFDKSMMTYQYNQGKPFTIPIFTWIIKGGQKNILVDTGEMNPIRSEDREAAINAKIYTFEEGLARHGLNPSDIDIVIHTHLHMDHCENDYKCENAIFYVHEAELASVHNPHPLDYRYLEDYIDDVEENGQISIVKTDMEIVDGIR